MSRFEITLVLNGGNWTITNGKPIIKEIVSISKRSADRAPQEKFSRFERRGTEELTFESYLRFQRVIIIQLTDQPREDQSFARTHESGRSFDVYTITIKSTNYQESQDIFDNMRDILIQTSPNATVSHYIIGSLTPAPSRGRWVYETEVEARKTGVVVDAG